MRQTGIAAAMLVLVGVLGAAAASAQVLPSPLPELAAATPPSGTMTATASAPEPSATLTAIATGTPTVVVPTAVRTPFADTPTPALPEQGGPPGGVLAGHLYIDENGNAARDKGEGTTGGTVFVRGLDLVDGGHAYLVPVASDTTGYWELRAVPDGSYQVYWQPPIPVDQLDKTIPPAQTITLNPNQTIRAVAQTVQIKGANRILDIDFGIPPQPLVVGPRVRLPGTGADRGTQSSASTWLVASAVGLCLAALSVATFIRRRAKNR